MADNNTLIAVSAFSGLAGAVLTQALTGLFAYINDTRKSKTELLALHRNKQIEIAESFYYVTGETMAIVKKSIAFWKNRNESRSASSLDFLGRDIKESNAQLEKLKSENWRYNLVGLYFNIKLSYNQLIAANTKSHVLYLKVLDIADRIADSAEAEKDALYERYNLSIFDLCSQYDHIYSLLEADIKLVKAELSKSFEVK